MNFNAPIPRAKQPTFHEGSALRSNRDSDATAKQWQKSRSIVKTVNSMAQAVEQTQKQVNKLQRRIIGGGGSSVEGWFWIEGERLYNPLESGYVANQIIKVTSDSTMATTGIDCGGTFQKATPGKWVCLQDVPALADDGNDDPAYIPQLPMPGGTDPDNAGNFWELITPSSVCLATGPAEV